MLDPVAGASNYVAYGSGLDFYFCWVLRAHLANTDGFAVFDGFAVL